MRLLDLSIKYAEDVVSEKELAPEEVRIQCEWFLRDLELQHSDDYKYYFAYDKLQIVENLLKLFNFATGLGVGDKCILDGLHPFQAFFITNIFGWRFKDDANRFKYRDITMFIPRKNAKTFLVAVILLLLLLTEDEYSEFYSICLDRELASEVKKAMSQILSASPLVNKYFKVPKSLNGKVLCTITNSFYQPRTATANANNAIRPSAFISDEVGAFTSYDNINAMKSGQLSVRNPLRFKLTTAYAEDKSIMLQELEYIRKVYKGVIKDDRQFALLYYAPEEHLWDEQGLYMSNPLRIEANYNEIRDNRKKALENKGEEAEYLTKNMNHFMPSMVTESFIDIAKVKECVIDKGTINWQSRDVYVGVDLSMTTDLTSVSMVTYDEDTEEIYARSWAFMPENRINEQSLKQKVDYYKEIQLGNCFSCGEDVIDYGFVEEFIMSLEEKYGVNVIQIGFDRYNAMNKWIKKKIATGKIDCIVSTINALFLLNVALIDSIGEGFIVGVY